MYINNVCHVWKVCLGVPYATNYWQVGDLSKQSDTFKVLWYRKKQLLATFRHDQGMSMVISPEDGMPLLNSLWEHAYGRTITNKLLSHPNLLPNKESPINQDQDQSQTSSSGTGTGTGNLQPSSWYWYIQY
jgi:hypothetical protein